MSLQGTKVEGTIGRLFEGRMHNFVECVNVDFKSTRQEVYADLQLLVRGCKHMYDSFDKYVEVEDLNGQNQYQAEGHGLQVRTAFFTVKTTYTNPCMKVSMSQIQI